MSAEPKPGDEDRLCCYGAACAGACTCWVPEYDCEQEPARPGPATVRARPCGDCGCRRDQPEHGLVAMLALSGTPFYCHEGMRRLVREVHPDGSVIEAPPGAYVPLLNDGIPYRADGAPAARCAGWAALAGRAAT